MATNNIFANISFQISDISLLNHSIRNADDVKQCFDEGVFDNPSLFGKWEHEVGIADIASFVQSPLRKRMSQLSQGICASLERGVKQTLRPNEEIYLFTGFAEIETTNSIIKSIIDEHSAIVSPTLFHNSVHNTPLGYFTVINKLHNYCVTVSDGLDTNKSFADFMRLRLQLPDSLIVAAGEENSSFYALDTTRSVKIRPAFISYRITPNIGSCKMLSPVRCLSDIITDGYDYIFADKATFETMRTTHHNVYTEYAITADMPCAVTFRLAMPQLCGLKGRSLIIDKTTDNYLLFEAAN